MDGMLDELDFVKDIGSVNNEPTFRRVIVPWGNTDFYVLEDDISNNPEIIDLIDAVNKNAFNAPVGPIEMGGLKVKEGFKYKKSRKMLVRLLKSKDVKIYSQQEMADYCKKHNESNKFSESINLNFDE